MTRERERKAEITALLLIHRAVALEEVNGWLQEWLDDAKAFLATLPPPDDSEEATMLTDEELCHQIGTEVVAALIGPDSHLLNIERARRVGVIIRQGLSVHSYARLTHVIGPSKTELFDALHPRLE